MLKGVLPLHGPVGVYTICIVGELHRLGFEGEVWWWFANRTSSSSVQYMPDGILKPKNYRKYKDRQNR
jgi:hypothetical protein